MSQRAAPGLSNGTVASGQRRVTQMCTPIEFGVIANQELSAPNLAVGAIARAVEGHSDHRAAQSVVGHATGNMRMMMLHADGGQPRFFLSETSAEVIGVKVISSRNWRDPKEALQVSQRFAEE